MAGTKQVEVPDIGGFEAVDVVEVLVAVGDTVAVDDPLITLESDKASMEVPSTTAGRVAEVHVAAGGKVSEGDPIVTLEVETTEPEPAPEREPQPKRPAPVPTEDKPTEDKPTEDKPAEDKPAEHAPATPSLPHASPAIRRFARELGVDLASVSGSGRNGRITREDVQGFVKRRLAGGLATEGFALPERPAVDFAKFGDIERVELSRIQKLSGANVHRS